MKTHDLSERARMRSLASALSKTSQRPLAVFLGAGASKPFGYPITRELMLKIFQHIRRVQKGRQKNAQRRLHEFLVRLLPGERASEALVPMVTSVLSLLDHALATGQVLLPESSLEETREARETLERELIRAIPDDEAFNATELKLFDNYCDWLESLYLARKSARLGIVTSNYDMLSDVAACYVTKVHGDLGDWRYTDVAKKIDFGFRWNHPYKNISFPRPDKPRFSLYKLHGSTNWLRCPLCENLYVNPDGRISMLAGSGFSWRGNVCHCSNTLLEAQIVSPSFLRSVRDPNLIAIWRNALDLLRESDQWLIVGYGFPDEDVAIRALFTRAFSSRKKPPQVSVVQLGAGALPNYQSFFPSDNFQYYTGGLQMLLECLR
jgi:NAD-dependent SIR2 family protein deacetylase